MFSELLEVDAEIDEIDGSPEMDTVRSEECGLFEFCLGRPGLEVFNRGGEKLMEFGLFIEADDGMSTLLAEPNPEGDNLDERDSGETDPGRVIGTPNELLDRDREDDESPPFIEFEVDMAIAAGVKKNGSRLGDPGWEREPTNPFA